MWPLHQQITELANGESQQSPQSSWRGPALPAAQPRDQRRGGRAGGLTDSGHRQVRDRAVSMDCHGVPAIFLIITKKPAYVPQAEHPGRPEGWGPSQARKGGPHLSQCPDPGGRKSGGGEAAGLGLVPQEGCLWAPESGGLRDRGLARRMSSWLGPLFGMVSAWRPQQDLLR